MGDATLYTVLPTHTADAGIALSAVGLMLGLNRFVRLLFNGMAGYANDRWPKKNLYTGAMLIGTLSTLLYAAGGGFWVLFFARVIWGLSWSGIWVGGTAIVLDCVPEKEKGRAVGLYQTWFFLGAAVGALAGGFLTDLIGYTSTMWTGGAVTAAGGLAAWIFLPAPVREKNGTEPPAKSLASDTDVSALKGPAESYSTPAMLRIKLNIAAAAYGVNRMVFAGVLSATLGLLVRESVRSTLEIATLTGILSAGRTVISMAAAPQAGFLSDRLGGRWKILGVCLGLGAVGMAAAGTTIFPLVVFGMGLGAAASGAIQSLSTTLTGEYASPSRRGRTIGHMHTMGDLGSAAGPLIAYALLPRFGLSGIYLFCGAVLLLLGGITLRYYLRR
jgi:MFS family permease